MNHNVLHRTPLDAAGSRAAGLERLPLAEGLFRTKAATGTLESRELESERQVFELKVQRQLEEERKAIVASTTERLDESWQLRIREKELTHLRDELAAQRRALPWVPVDTEPPTRRTHAAWTPSTAPTKCST